MSVDLNEIKYILHNLFESGINANPNFVEQLSNSYSAEELSKMFNIFRKWVKEDLNLNESYFLEFTNEEILEDF